MKYIAIIATRDYPESKILAYLMSMQVGTDYVMLITGGHTAGQAATEAGIRRSWGTSQYLPDYKKYGKTATHIRSYEMIQCADEVLCFWDGQSKGTQNEINYAQKAGKPITYLDQRPQQKVSTQISML